MSNLIREDYVLGNKKIVVGDNLHDLVLENLGKIWIRYGNGYKEFSNFISTLTKSTTDVSKVVIEPNGIQSADAYKSGQLIFDASKKNLYLKYEDTLLLLLEYNDNINEKYISKSGDTMTGPLTINVKSGTPLYVNSAQLIENLNAQYLSGKNIDDFALREEDEDIIGDWTFYGNNEHNGRNTFNNQVIINGELEANSTSEFAGKATFNNEIEVTGQATFKNNGTAIRVGTGDIVTDGSIGSSQFMSGMTGYGWKLDASTNTLTIDNLVVRGVLNVFELVVNKITATNGSFWVTDSFKIDKVRNIKYLKTSDFQDRTDEENQTIRIDINENFLRNLFNVDDCYIPVTGFETTYTIQSNDPTHPFATRDNFNDQAKTFSNLKWIFSILRLDDFINKFLPSKRQETECVQEIVNLADYVNTYLINEYNIFFDEEGYLKIQASENTVFNYADQLPDFEKEAEENYLVFEDNQLITSANSQNKISKDDYNTLQIEARIYREFTYPESPELNITDIFDESVLINLADGGYIQLVHPFQKNPKNINEVDELGGNNNLLIYKDGWKDFISNTFTIVNSKQATLNDSNKYTFNTSALAHINLYYKYFGSNLNDGMNLYVLEAKESEYPVFKPGDIIKCQKFIGTSVQQYHALVIGIFGSYGFIIQLQNYSILQEGTTYEYDENGKLIESNSNLDSSLYNKSQGISVDFDIYLSKAKELLQKYITDRTVDYRWCIQILSKPENIDSYINEIEAANNDEDLISIIQNIINNSIQSLTWEEISNHPIFKKILQESTSGIPQKDDSLVRIGSIYPGDRRNSMYLTSSEQNSPYQDVLVDINRPDYTVNYLTPKYKSFEGSFTYNGNTRKGKFFVQNKEFQSIMKIGDELKYNNKTWSLENIPTSVEKTYLLNLYEDEFENMLPKFKSIYTQFRPYTILNQYTSGNSNEDIRSGSFVFNPSNLVYDNNNEIITNEEGLYFTEDILNTIIGVNFSDNNHLQYQENNNTINVTIGGL